MQYMGGKSKIARRVAAAILADTPVRQMYLEPFVGGGSMFAALAPHFNESGASDASEDLILMWQAVADGWVPPSEVSEEEYAALKDAAPSALRGFVGYGCSFGGKWFGGYARQDTRPGRVSYAARSARNVDNYSEAFIGASVIGCCDYAEWRGAPGMVIYCDPPYVGTTGYDAIADGWDSERFYDTAERWVREGATVYVSEYAVGRRWALVWEASAVTSLAANANGGRATERLYRVEI